MLGTLNLNIIKKKLKRGRFSMVHLQYRPKLDSVKTGLMIFLPFYVAPILSKINKLESCP